MGVKEFAAKKKAQVEAYVEKQRLAAEKRRMKRELQDKLDRDALEQEAAKARRELADLKRAERHKAEVKKLKDYKQAQRKPIMSGFSSGGMDFGFGSSSSGSSSILPSFGSSKSSGDDMFAGMFGPARKPKRKKRKRR